MGSRVDAILQARKLDLAGVDLTRARSKTGDGRFLAHAVKEALAGAPRVYMLGQDDHDAIVTWITTQLKGMQASTTAIAAGCSAAITALEARRRAPTAPVVSVDGDAVKAAMKSALSVRAQRNATRAAKHGKPAAKTTPAAKPGSGPRPIAKKKGA